MLLLMEKGWIRCLNESLKWTYRKLRKHQTFRGAVLNQYIYSRWNRADLSCSKYSFLCYHRDKLFVCVDSRKDCSIVSLQKDCPCIARLQTVWALIWVLTENLMEQGQCIPAIVRSQVLNLTLDEVRQLVYQALKCLVVELIEDAQIQHSVPLLPPHLIVWVVGQL